uniref:Rpn family recombination-promoting nuclease/putative transposase n=1 Tax=Candidatus Kentrum sp. DK TaxID=2126562 RepID=A0A450SCF3_9GAMM|nr:MAG: conserved hypothetical protein (putative transposase or invertase) [Candidatus Kentron sp. DK]
MISKYLNPYTDFGFKKLFCEENSSRDLLIDFLNQLLPPHHRIAELAFRNTEHLPGIALEWRAVFDIFCTGVNGERFIVEMQKVNTPYFQDRSLFYVSLPIGEQDKEGQEWLFQLCAVYFIAILDFEYDEKEEKRRFLREIALRGQDGALFSDKLHFKFLQMPLFQKQGHELETHFDKWVYFLKNLPDLDHIPPILDEPIFQKAFQIAEVAGLSLEQYTAYEYSLLDYWTIQATQAAIDTARDEGREEGRKEGKRKEEEKTKKSIAIALKRDGLPPEHIERITGLASDAIAAL